MKKKIIILVIVILLLSGCVEPKNYEIDEVNNFDYEVIIDETTCVEYLSDTKYKSGGITVRYNKDGTIKVNESCLKEQE